MFLPPMISLLLTFSIPPDGGRRGSSTFHLGGNLTVQCRYGYSIAFSGACSPENGPRIAALGSGVTKVSQGTSSAGGRACHWCWPVPVGTRSWHQKGLMPRLPVVSFTAVGGVLVWSRGWQSWAGEGLTVGAEPEHSAPPPGGPDSALHSGKFHQHQQ